VLSSAFPTILMMSFKTYYRNGQAIFFSVVFPLLIMLIFGLLNLGGSASVNIGVVDLAHNQASRQLIDGLRKVEAVHLFDQQERFAIADLNSGGRDLVAVLPTKTGAGPTTITAYLNQARPAQSQVARAILEQSAARASFGVAGTQPAFAVEAKPLAGRNVTYVDFLVPGVIGMSVMQTGIFSLAFALVRLKDNGSLRRLLATPMRKIDFLAAQVVVRVLMAIVQVVLLLAVAVLLFHFDLFGNVGYLLLAAGLGATIFISLGFVIAGVSKNEDTVPALGNLVVLPMMFLSGVFFPIDSVPSWLRVVSDRLPLTYLNEALRRISVNGNSLWEVRWNVVWMGAWLVVMTVLALRTFRWESA
jgi:ABC-2 type transport system permease protein